MSPKIAYISKRFSTKTIAVIDAANAIIEEYTAQGFDLTLRQLFYQFVSRGLMPNEAREYTRLGNVINTGRMGGKIDWDAITDRTRNVIVSDHGYESPAAFVDGLWRSYTVRMWADQPYAPEVWIEKDALAGVMAPVCEDLRVPYFSTRGYTSQSEMRAAGQRLSGHADEGRRPVVFHFGDHDPSGIDISRDIEERLCLFGAPVEFRRLALSRDQIDEHDPPPNPAKLTDTRAADYIEAHGTDSWELDALEPAILGQLVRDAVMPLIDAERWARAIDRERFGQDQIRRALDGLSL